MFVFNALNPDVRVVKEAKTLTEAGYDVKIIAFMDNETAPYEERDGFRIFRVTLDPIHRKIIRLASRLARLAGITSEGSKSVPGSFGVGEERANEKSSNSSKVQQQGSADVSIPYPLPRTYGRLYRAVVYLIRLLPTTYLSYLEYYYRSFRLARQEPADIYHAHDLNTLPVAWLCSRLRKGNLVYDSHELWLDLPRIPERSRFNRFLVQTIESFLIRRTDANIVAGESSRPRTAQAIWYRRANRRTWRSTVQPCAAFRHTARSTWYTPSGEVAAVHRNH